MCVCVCLCVCVCVCLHNICEDVSLYFIELWCEVCLCDRSLHGFTVSPSPLLFSLEHFYCNCPTLSWWQLFTDLIHLIETCFKQQFIYYHIPWLPSGSVVVFQIGLVLISTTLLIGLVSVIYFKTTEAGVSLYFNTRIIVSFFWKKRDTPKKSLACTNIWYNLSEGCWKKIFKWILAPSCLYLFAPRKQSKIPHT